MYFQSITEIYLPEITYYNALLIRQSRHDFTDLWSRAGPCPNETGGVLILGAGTHSQGVQGHFGGLLLGDDLEPLSQPLRDQLPEQLGHREGLPPVELIILCGWRTTNGASDIISKQNKNKRPMGHIAHLRNTHMIIIMLIKRRGGCTSSSSHC